MISRAGGREIQAESNEKAPIATGTATYTTAGTLPYKYVIHTVGPIFRGGTDKEEQLLASAVRSALEVAGELGLKSISLPSISTGIFGYPLAPAIKTIAGTIFDFLEHEETSLEEIHLVEYSEEKAQQINAIILKHFLPR